MIYNVGKVLHVSNLVFFVLYPLDRASRPWKQGFWNLSTFCGGGGGEKLEEETGRRLDRFSYVRTHSNRKAFKLQSSLIEYHNVRDDSIRNLFLIFLPRPKAIRCLDLKIQGVSIML